MADIAFELGIHKGTVPVVAKRRSWKRYVPPPRDVSPATRILVEAEGLERRREAAQSGPDVERALPRSRMAPAANSGDAILSPACGVRCSTSSPWSKSLRDRLKNEPQSRVAAERTARTLSTLTDTLQKLQRLQCAVPANGSDYDMPADIDEFRNELARRIDAFVESRIGRRRC